MDMIIGLIAWTLFLALPISLLLTYLIHRHDEKGKARRYMQYVNTLGWKTVK